MRDEIDRPLVELLLCASDLARGNHGAPVVVALQYLGIPLHDAIVADARNEAMGVARRVFDYRGDLLADTLLEAAYRVAEGRTCAPAFEEVRRIYRRSRRLVERGPPRRARSGSDSQRQAAFDRDVSEVFHRRLHRAGIEVEQ